MAELAAKIKAKFQRRHSAIPGIPSLLTRSSLRSSSGSHASSSLSPSRSHTTDHTGPVDEAEGDSPRSRPNSSQVSSPLLQAQQSDQLQEDGHEGADGGEGGHGGQNDVAAVAQTQEEAHGESLQRSTSPEDIQHPDNVSSTGYDIDHTNTTTPPEPPDDQQQQQADVQQVAAAAIPAENASAAEGDPPNQAAGTEAPALSVAPPLAPAAPTDPATTDSHQAPVNNLSGNDLHMQVHSRSSQLPLPFPQNPNPNTNPTPNHPPAPSPRKLSSIHEVPSPEKDPHRGPAIEDDDDDHDHHHPTSPFMVPSTADTHQLLPPISKKPPTSRSLSASTLKRPLHIPLPPASFGPPSAANLSPNAVYSAVSTTAPSSPLRHSVTVAADSNSTTAPARPLGPVRRQSLLSNRQSTLINTLLRGSHAEDLNSLNPDHLLPISGNMVMRKIWVKRPGGSPTLVTINEDDVVDDVRDMILRKYANSLGRQFDSPDLTLRIKPGGNQQERILGPEEPMARTLDAYFSSGQSIDDALIIDVPLRRTPRASPRAGPPHAPAISYYVDDPRPPETANDYFGPGALTAAHVPVTVTAPSNGSGHSHAISVLSTGQVPQIPSPGGGSGRRAARDYRDRPERPRLGRQHTSSPTLINLASGAAHQGSIAAAAAGTQAAILHGSHARQRSRTHSEASSDPSQTAAAPAPMPMPTPPAVTDPADPQRVATPPPRTSSPRPAPRPKKSKKNTEHPLLPKGMLNGSVPPINVLIVEDNIINLKLLEAFVKRLKVRWSTAMNGRDAVTKWRDGGFHLVLMDIQLPVMSGLDATREIRRLERVNSIGVFSSAASTAPEEVKGEPDEKDKLENMELFKSPVIIVALTASSLQSDRHEALAAGCNDFLTKVCALSLSLSLSIPLL